MFLTVNYRGGFIHFATFGNRTTIRAHFRYQSAEVKSEHAAKLWISRRVREQNEQTRRDAAEHMQAIRNIWGRE